MAHAVEHSSMSLSQLAVASRSKLRPPSSVKSPPKRAGKAACSEQAANSHLAKLAAAVPLPASPNGADGHSCLEDTAAVALATAVAKPPHIPAPAAKPSRLKKPTNTSGFFSSGRSFTGAGSNSRYTTFFSYFMLCMLLSFICLMLYRLLAVSLVAVMCSIGKIHVSGAAVSLID